MPFYYKLDRNTPAGRRTAENLLLLRERLATNEDGTPNIPKRTIDETLLFATWNIREFDSSKYGDRSEESIYYIAEIISHFDIVAIQEVNADLAALERLMQVLGSWWRYLITDVTEGSSGNQERAALVYDSRKVKYGGLAGEIVIPPIKKRGKPVEPANQLSRTPFVCGFQAGWLKFMVCTVHIYYGKSVAEDPKRVEEIQVLSSFLANRVKDKHAWCQNLALVGDFNIFNTEDATFKAITDAGFYIPPQFKEVTSNAAGGKHFDQMGFISRAYDEAVVRERIKGFKAGVFDFFKYVYTDKDESIYAAEIGPAYSEKSNGEKRTERDSRNYYRQWRTFQMSDHFPMWIELDVDFGKDYLGKIAGD
jgi:endonuclease/exonuclease/phosphatase family metal-dependent hydrolase